MILLDVYGNPAAEALLFKLLQERTPEQSISHKDMPTLEEHRAFIASRPYEAWYLVEAAVDIVDCVALITELVGAVYLTRQREIGVGILKQYRGNGYGKHAVKAVIQRHPGARFLWNVNPANAPSIALARSIGFGLEPIQHTYELAHQSFST
jgi:RimJ/RimL family protein N-acetyltransferase